MTENITDGAIVFWNDPEGLSSGEGIVIKINGEVITVADIDEEGCQTGGIIEAFEHELTLIDD